MSGGEEREGSEAERAVRGDAGGRSAFAELLQGAPGPARIAADTVWRCATAPRRAEDFWTEALRRRGEELLRQSADVGIEQDSHPACMRILDALAPDEARNLRFLAQSGPQPSVDVRSRLPLATELISQGRTMVGEEAGCRYGDRVYAYFNDLHRLGLIWFSREPPRDSQRYQVLEAQPEVTGTARRRRSSLADNAFRVRTSAICACSCSSPGARR